MARTLPSKASSDWFPNMHADFLAVVLPYTDISDMEYYSQQKARREQGLNRRRLQLKVLRDD
jgi:septum formation topological specificity factor MinE